jgi:hypothetical protein
MKEVLELKQIVKSPISNQNMVDEACVDCLQTDTHPRTNSSKVEIWLTDQMTHNQKVKFGDANISNISQEENNDNNIPKR